MKKYVVVITSNRATKDGRFNVFGGQGFIREEFGDFTEAKKYAEKVSDDIRRGNLPCGLKTTDKTAFIEIMGFAPYTGFGSIFKDERIRYSKSKTNQR